MSEEDTPVVSAADESSYISSGVVRGAPEEKLTAASLATPTESPVSRRKVSPTPEDSASSIANEVSATFATSSLDQTSTVHHASTMPYSGTSTSKSFRSSVDDSVSEVTGLQSSRGSSGGATGHEESHALAETSAVSMTADDSLMEKFRALREQSSERCVAKLVCQSPWNVAESEPFFFKGWCMFCSCHHCSWRFTFRLVVLKSPHALALGCMSR